jgi:hypothetical protein
MSRASRSLTPMFGIAVCGSMACGLRIQRIRLSWLFGSMPAMTGRFARPVQRPADVDLRPGHAGDHVAGLAGVLRQDALAAPRASPVASPGAPRGSAQRHFFGPGAAVIVR